MTEETPIEIPGEIKKQLINRKTFKEKWLEVDEVCPTCHQVTKRAEGLTRQNIRRLLVGKPSTYDWIFFFIIVMTLFMAYQYNIETAQSREIIANPIKFCMQVLGQSNSLQPSPFIPNLNLTYFNITNVK